MKLYDFDGMFDEKISAHIAKNAGKLKESEWEDKIPELYKKFGNTVIKSIGKTPKQFYASFSDVELIKCLRAHLKQNVPVSGFLSAEIEERGIEKQLLPLLDGSAAECEYAMTVFGATECAIEKYMNLLLTSGDDDIKDKCLEYLVENADAAAKYALENYKNGVEMPLMVEILSKVNKLKSDEIFDILIKELKCDFENLPLHIGHIVSYGDDRALKYLSEKIDEEGISYLDFRELKFAIEALGGEYLKQRDFSDDPFYKLIKPQG